MACIWSFRLNFVKNLCLNYYSQNLVLFNFRGDNARVFQRAYMNLNMTVGQAACQLLCPYTKSTLAMSCVCWIVPIVMCDSFKKACGCSCMHVISGITDGGRGANRLKRVRPGCVCTPSVWDWSSNVGKDGLDCAIIDVNSALDESAKRALTSMCMEVTCKCCLFGLSLLLALTDFAHM